MDPASNMTRGRPDTTQEGLSLLFSGKAQKFMLLQYLFLY